METSLLSKIHSATLLKQGLCSSSQSSSGIMSFAFRCQASLALYFKRGVVLVLRSWRVGSESGNWRMRPYSLAASSLARRESDCRSASAIRGPVFVFRRHPVMIRAQRFCCASSLARAVGAAWFMYTHAPYSQQERT